MHFHKGQINERKVKRKRQIMKRVKPRRLWERAISLKNQVRFEVLKQQTTTSSSWPILVFLS